MRGDRLASIWKRVFAYLIDILIVNSIIIRPLNKLLQAKIPENISSLLVFISNFSFRSVFLISLISGIITISYWAILEFKIQQTFGGILLGIKVKNEVKQTKFSQFFLRNITKVSFLVLLLDSIHVLYSDKKQRFSEKLSKTITIENEK